MRTWKHSGFSVDISLRIGSGDQEGMRRLIEYAARSPFSLSRMVGLTPDGKVIYRAGKAECQSYPEVGNEELKAGIPRNFQVFSALDFLAEVTQHIPNKGEHQIRHYGSTRFDFAHRKSSPRVAGTPTRTEAGGPGKRAARRYFTGPYR